MDAMEKQAWQAPMFPFYFTDCCDYELPLQIHPDEVEDDEEIMLIWDFDVDDVILSFTASQCSVKELKPRFPLRCIRSLLCDI